jgi:uncharacterized membrane protein YheB (UPF0754 family)
LDFNENAKVHYLLNEFVLDLIYNTYSGEMWQPDYLNSIDRDDLGEQFVKIFIREYEEEVVDEQGRLDKELIKLLTDYSSKEIDRLIPKVYFLEKNKELCEKYTQLLVRRIYDVAGHEAFDYTKNFKFQYNHSDILSETKKTMEETRATEKQIQYLNDLGKNIGYLLWHEEYLSKNYANQLIEYLSEKSYVEPIIFSFFFVSK